MKPVDLYVLYRIVRRISTPFEKWDMYKTGVIDDKGNFLVPKENRTAKQLGSYSYLDIFVLNIKKALARIPGGSTRIATFAAALYLLKEGKSIKEEFDLDSFMSEFDSYLESARLLIEDEGGAASITTSNTGNIAQKDNPMNIPDKLKKKHKLKSFKEFMTEAFDSSVSYKRVNGQYYTFGDIHIKFHKSNRFGGGYHHEIEFYKIDDRGNKHHDLTKNNTTGAALKILSTINKIIVKYLSSENMKTDDLISFTAYDNRTIRLYSRFADNLAKTFGMDMAKSDNQFMLRKI